MSLSSSPADPLAKARDLLRRGLRDEAEHECLAVLARERTVASAWVLLGGLRLERGAHAEAATSLREAIAIDPAPATRLHLAVAEFRSGALDLARATLEALVAEQPGDIVATFHLGLVNESARDDESAGRWYARTLERAPRHVEAALRYGRLLQRNQRFADALRVLDPAFDPQRPVLAGLIARACLETGDIARAREYAGIAVRLVADAEAWLLLGVVLRQSGAAAEAEEALQRAFALAPNHPLLLSELGCNARDLGEFERGQGLLARARELAPDWHVPRWLHDLGLPQLPASDDEVDRAIDACVHGLDGLIEDLEDDHHDLRRTALDGLGRTRPFALHYLPRDTTSTSLRFGDLAACVVLHAVDDELREPLDWRALEHGGRLRVGFVSCELRTHTITRYFGGWLEGIDTAVIEMHAWHLGAIRDATSDRIAARADAFHHLPLAAPQELARHLRDARLDVLVYLDVGMDERPQVLASLRLAPVQCAAYGHPVTTGLHEVDWFLSSDAMEPEDARHHYRESLERLPGLGVTFARPSAPSPAIDALRVQGRPLLLCLQSLFKLVPAFDDMLARIAAATDAKIVLFESPRTLSPRFMVRARGAFAARGLDVRNHLEIIDRRPHADYLALVASADMVLDSIGFSGGATSLDALGVGTPVVTLEGEFMRGRQTAAMLRLCEVDELVATTKDEYVDLAIALCADASRRSALRARILQGADALFERADAVPALEAFLWRVARAAAHAQEAQHDDDRFPA